MLGRSLHVVVTASSATLVALLSKLGTTASVVDKPVADLEGMLVIEQ
jgi:hypothetical protein